MTSSAINLPSAAFSPRRLKPGNIGNWSGHLPFARDLVAALRPSIFVELGTHYGESYFGFCQSIAENAIDCKAYAIDTWRGEHQSGFYDESIFEDVRRYNEANYQSFSYLVRGLFDDALAQFDDNSIDILHIDGLHTFDAVSHDFYSWLPKVKPGGIVLLHDTMVKQDDFGVWKLWGELRNKGETFEFHHSSGLGVFEKPQSQAVRSGFLDALFCPDPDLHAHIRRYYFLSSLELEWKHDLATRPLSTGDEYLLQVFVPTLEGYNEQRSRTVKLDPGKWQRVSVELTEGFSQGALRIDIVNRPCLIDIRGIALHSSVDGCVLWKTSGKMTDIVPRGTLMRLTSNEETGAARFFSFGFDPQLYVPSLPSNAFDQPLMLEVWLRIETSLEQLLPLFEQSAPAVAPQDLARLGKLESELASARGEAEAAYRKLAEMEHHVRTLEEERRTLEEERKSLEEERQSLIDEGNARQTKIYLLSESHAAWKETEDKYAKLTKTHESLQRDHQKLEESFHRLAAEYEGLEKTFRDVISSRSWKITSPMRALIRSLPRPSR
jgi:hypothetical protein